MSTKTIVGVIVVIIALGVAIYFFQSKVITVVPTDGATESTAPKNTMPVKDLPPTMEDGTIEPGSSTTPNTY